MSSSGDALDAEQLYASGKDEELLERAAAFWDRHGSTGPGAAEVARFTRIAAYRSRPEEDQIWQARAVEAACLAGAWRSLALSLRQYSDKLIGSGELDAAGSVLHVMQLLVDIDHDGAPERDLAEGILAERRAVLFAERQDWSAAAKWFSKALDLCPAGERRELKVKGGLTRTRWLAGGPDEEAVRDFQVLVDASSAWPDVRQWAETNLQAAQAGDRTKSVPFDLL